MVSNTFKMISLSTLMNLSVPNEVFHVERTKLDIYVFFIMVKIVVSRWNGPSFWTLNYQSIWDIRGTFC